MKLPFEITENQKQRLQSDMNKMAEENVDIHINRGQLFVFGSEVACYRIAWCYKNRIQDITVDFSETMQKWYFTINESN